MKCQDLKHQIKAFSSMNESSERRDYVKEIQQAVSIYDAIFHTGSEALDYVLCEKSLLFNEYHIAFSCMANGNLLQFMSSADIYALMGNALEREMQKKEDERSVSLHINQHYDLILIHLENRCSMGLRFEDNLPVTNKKIRINTGLEFVKTINIPKIALGAWPWGAGAAGGDQVFGNHYFEENIRPVFEAAVKAGLNLWDTAAVYGEGSSERILGNLAKEVDRDSIIISTKSTPQIASDSKDAMQEMINGSKERLHTDYIDVYWIHNRLNIMTDLLRLLEKQVSV